MPVLLIPGFEQQQSDVFSGFDDKWGRGLAFAFEASLGQRDLVTNYASIPATGVTYGGGSKGFQAKFSGSQADKSCTFGVHHGMDGATEATWDILVYFSGANPSANIFCQWDGNTQEWLLQASSGSLIWVPADDTASARTRFDLSGAFPAAGWYRILASWWSTSSKLLLINSVDKTSSISVNAVDASSIGTNNTLDELQIGMATGGAALNGSVVFARAWRVRKTLAELQALNSAPWCIFANKVIPLFWSSNPPQIVYPNGDVAGGAWLPSTGTDLYACIDETSASDTDYIYTTVPGAYQEFTFPNCGAVDPSTGGHVRYRIPAGTGTITAILKQGSTTLQTLGTHTLTGSAQDIDITISASVADSDDLRVGFTASA